MSPSEKAISSLWADGSSTKKPVRELACAEGSNQHIHALLTDLIMARMRGSELAKRLKALPSRIKVIYVSGYLNYQQSGNEFVEEALFVQKPFTRTTWIAHVAELLKEDFAVARLEHQRLSDRTELPQGYSVNSQ